MPGKKIEVREDDHVTIRLPVRVVRENNADEQLVTLELFGQRVTGLLRFEDVVKHEKGNGWPERD